MTEVKDFEKVVERHKKNNYKLSTKEDKGDTPKQKVEYLLKMLSAGIVKMNPNDSSMDYQFLIDDNHRETIQLWLMAELKKYAQIK